MTTMRKVSLPKAVKAELMGTTLRITGPKGQLERNVRFPQINIAVKDGEVIISTEAGRKSIVAMVGTFTAHINNMCRGVSDGYEYRMKVVYSHFPIQLKLQGTTLEINNFLGEKKPRYAHIADGVVAKVGNDEIVLSGIDKERVGTTSANIEHATRIRNRDPRIFQDGIYIVKKV